MPLGKAYDNKYMTEQSKQGEMNPMPEGQLYREALEAELISPATGFESTTNAPSGPGSVHNQEKAIFALADDYSLYNEAGK